MKFRRTFCALVAGVALAGAAVPCHATEQAVLRNGFAIDHERREVVDGGRTTRLFLTDEGSSFVDVATADITGFEKASAKAPVDLPIRELTEPDISAIVREASHNQSIDEDLLRSLINAESSFKTNAVSKKGARGLMQLMPSTAQGLGVKDSFDARENVMGGTRYLRELLTRYNNDIVKALAAYNAGAHRVDQYKGVPPYRETRLYVAQIVREYNKAKLAERGLAGKSARAGGKTKVASAAAGAVRAHKENHSINE
jgi:soluble lytic murein transglycosylase-like protein